MSAPRLPDPTAALGPDVCHVSGVALQQRRPVPPRWGIVVAGGRGENWLADHSGRVWLVSEGRARMRASTLNSYQPLGGGMSYHAREYPGQ